MALSLKAHWAFAIALTATGAAAYGAVMLDKHIKETTVNTPGECKEAYYANGLACVAKNSDGTPVSIDINQPETPRR